jgi:hypothetical protein
MRTALFGHQSTGHADQMRERVARSSDPDRPVLEQQQALLLEVLRRAGGLPVSYAELNDAGVEFPASAVSELELAGVAIERCSGGGPGWRGLLGVRLAPASDPDPRSIDAEADGRPISDMPRRVDWEPVHVYRTGAARTLLEGALVGAARLVPTGRRSARWTAGGWPAIGTRMLAPLALLAAAGVAAAVVVSALPGGGGPRAHASAARYHPPAIASVQVIVAHAAGGRDHMIATSAAPTRMPSRSARSTRTTPKTTALSATTSTPIPSTPATHPSSPPVSPAPALPTAAGLQARGHEMMVAGRYDQAVPVLRQALRATGERRGACLQPTTQTCLTYAFALYDLGRSLSLAGHPAAAVRILKHRLQIDNQRSVVAAELAHARRQARRRGGKHHVTR